MSLNLCGQTFLAMAGGSREEEVGGDEMILEKVTVMLGGHG